MLYHLGYRGLFGKSFFFRGFMGVQKTVRSSNVESSPGENFFFSSSVVEKKKNERKNKPEVFIKQRLLYN